MDTDATAPLSQDPFDRELMRTQFAGMEHMIPELLSVYRQSVGECLDETRRALRAGVMAEVCNAAHALKGMSSAVCAVFVRDQARMLEEAARKGDLQAALAALAGLEEQVERAVAHAVRPEACPQ